MEAQNLTSLKKFHSVQRRNRYCILLCKWTINISCNDLQKSKQLRILPPMPNSNKSYKKILGNQSSSSSSSEIRSRQLPEALHRKRRARSPTANYAALVATLAASSSGRAASFHWQALSVSPTRMPAHTPTHTRMGYPSEKKEENRRRPAAGAALDLEHNGFFP